MVVDAGLLPEQNTFDTEQSGREATGQERKVFIVRDTATE